VGISTAISVGGKATGEGMKSQLKETSKNAIQLDMVPVTTSNLPVVGLKTIW
jgi:hypothetical protein